MKECMPHWSLHLTEKLPEGRTDLVRLATGETFVRPTAFTRVIPDTAGVLVVNAGNDGPDESQNGNLAVDAAIGIRPRPSTAPSVAAATVSTATGKGVGKNGTPAEALHVMNGMLVHYRLSRNGPVNLEVSAALTRLDFGKDVTGSCSDWTSLSRLTATSNVTRLLLKPR